MSPRVILITGGNGGLAQAMARAFVADPCSLVHLTWHQRHDHIDTLAAEFPQQVRHSQLSVTDRDAWKATVDQLTAAHGRIDVLVNNAGSHSDGLLGTLPLQAWTDVLESNLTGTFHGCQAVLPAMISQRSGRIINISSLSALLAPAGQTNYAAAKAGVVALTQSLAKEVARLGITVNAICPGYIETEALKSLSLDDQKQATQRIPMRRFGRPAEVAAAVRFLASSEASYITGSVLKVDGGIF